jgi:hypothetical protein
MSDMVAGTVLAVATVLDGGEPLAPVEVRAPVGAPLSSKELCSVAADCKSEVTTTLGRNAALSAGDKPGSSEDEGTRGEQIVVATLFGGVAVGF